LKKSPTISDGIFRIVIVILVVFIQFVLLVVFVAVLKQYTIYAFFLMELAGVIEVLLLVDKNKTSEYTTKWLLVILIIPVLGHLLYLLWGRRKIDSKKSKRIHRLLSTRNQWLSDNSQAVHELQQRFPEHKKLSTYLQKEGFTVYKNTTCKYYPLGKLQFDDMLIDLNNAKRFIFLEYFTISEGPLWNSIHRVLKEKASAGVEIRLLYDDLGSILTLPDNFIQTLTNENIQVLRFNAVHKHLSRFYFNYRNHQKLAVIDGQIGYTGGNNLADEYIKAVQGGDQRRDSAIRLTGDAVWNLTVTFLQMWETESNATENYSRYHTDKMAIGDGFYLPFNDGPMNYPNNPTEAAYRQMIYSAQNYLWIATPYLMIDDLMVDTLCFVSRSGVDVRIITSKKWHHFYENMVTHTHYSKLLEAGIHIYEYTPGYIHAKTILSDDTHAITGSVNMNYHSFYLHFTNGVWICGAPMLTDMKKDIVETLTICKEISFQAWEKRPLHIKLIEKFFRLLIPIL